MTVASDQNALAGYRRALARRGTPVLVRRISGASPNTATFDARVLAVVTDYLPKPPIATVQPEGAVTLGGRNVMVLADDLAQKRFPLPVAKNDKLVINLDARKLGQGPGAGDQELNIISVDPNKRGIAGAIDIMAEGV